MLQTEPRPIAHDDPSGGLAHVQRLATELAARMRYAQIVARPLPPEQITALVSAARLLQERGEPWPQIVGEVLQQVADDLAESRAEGSTGHAAAGAEPAPEANESRKVTGLTRFLGAFRREQASRSEG